MPKKVGAHLAHKGAHKMKRNIDKGTKKKEQLIKLHSAGKMTLGGTLMIDISSFKSVQIKDENQRTPLLCVTETTVSFGIGALEALLKPHYARLVANDAARIVVLVGCSQEDPEAFEFVKKDSDRYVRLKSRALHRLCDKLSGFSSSDYPYRVSGQVDVLPNDQPAVIFSMDKARKVKKTDEDD